MPGSFRLTPSNPVADVRAGLQLGWDWNAQNALTAQRQDAWQQERNRRETNSRVANEYVGLTRDVRGMASPQMPTGAGPEGPLNLRPPAGDSGAAAAETPSAPSSAANSGVEHDDLPMVHTSQDVRPQDDSRPRLFTQENFARNPDLARQLQEAQDRGEIYIEIQRNIFGLQTGLLVYNRRPSGRATTARGAPDPGIPGLIRFGRNPDGSFRAPWQDGWVYPDVAQSVQVDATGPDTAAVNTREQVAQSGHLGATPSSASTPAATGGFTARFLVGGTTNRNGTVNTGDHAHITLPPELAGRANEVAQFLRQNGVTVNSAVRTQNAGADHPAGNAIDIDVSNQSEADQVVALLNRHYGGQGQDTALTAMQNREPVEPPVQLAFSAYNTNRGVTSRAIQMADAMFVRYSNMAEQYAMGGQLEQAQQASSTAFEAFQAGELARGMDAVEAAVTGGDITMFRALIAERRGISPDDVTLVPDQAAGQIVLRTRQGNGVSEERFTPNDLRTYGMYVLNDQFREQYMEFQNALREAMAEREQAESVARIGGEYDLAEARIREEAANQRAVLAAVQEAENQGYSVEELNDGTVVATRGSEVYFLVERPVVGGRNGETTRTWVRQQFTPGAQPQAGLQQ